MHSQPASSISSAAMQIIAVSAVRITQTVLLTRPDSRFWWVDTGSVKVRYPSSVNRLL